MGNYVYSLNGEPVTLESLAARTDEIIRRQKEEAATRNLAFGVAIIGAFFAAVKLGVVAVGVRRLRGSSDAAAASKVMASL